jgi:peptidoglycan-associated lipoprotein
MARYRWLILILALLLLLLPACAQKKTVPEEEIEPVEKVPPPPPLEEVEEPAEEEEVIIEEEPIELEDVFFDFDKFSIKDKYKKVLSANADILLAHPEVNLLIEGHCDERGTIEYNLALGEKRAKAVVDFFVAYGIDASRLSMVSYGEERPFAHGGTEQAWAKNRRAHMVVQ